MIKGHSLERQICDIRQISARLNEINILLNLRGNDCTRHRTHRYYYYRSDCCQAVFINAFHIVPPNPPDKSILGGSIKRLNGFPEVMKVTELPMLRLGNGCNIELFQTEPPTEQYDGNINHAGVNHFSVYVDDIYQA